MAKVIVFVVWGAVELLSVVLIVGVLIALFSCSLTTSAGLGEGVDNLAMVLLSFNGVFKVAIDEGGCFCSCCCCIISISPCCCSAEIELLVGGVSAARLLPPLLPSLTPLKNTL